MRHLVLALVTAAALTGPALAVDNDQKVPTREAEFTTAPKEAVLSYNLVGLKLVDGQQNTVGEIKDVVIANGQLAGYIVSVGGFLGMGERYVVVKPDSIALGYDEAGKQWKGIIAASKDQLKSAPEFKYEGKFDRK